MIVNRILAALLVVIVIVIFPAGIWALAASGALLSPDTYKNGLESQNLYADIVPIALPAIARTTDAESADYDLLTMVNNIRGQIGDDAWRDVANILVPPEWMRLQVNNGIDLFFTQLDGNADSTQTAIFDTETLRSHLTGDEAQRAISIIIDSAPLCTPEQTTRLEEFTPGQDSASLPICQPPAQLRDKLRQALMTDFERFSAQLAAIETNLSDVAGVEDENLANIRLLLSAYLQILSLGYLCPIGLLGLVVALTVRSQRSFWRWIGSTAIIVGVLAVLPLPFFRSGILDGITGLLSTSGEDLETRLFQARLAAGFLLSAFDALSGPVLIQGFVMIVVGGVGLWYSFRRSSPNLIITADGQVYSSQTGQVVGTITPSSLTQSSVQRTDDRPRP